MGKSFRERHAGELEALFADFRAQLLGEVLPFWEERVEDKAEGGYLNCFDRAGNLCGSVKPGWFVGRDMYTFAALYNTVAPREEWLRLARVGRRYMNGAFCAGRGRFNHLMGPGGRVLAGPVSIFTDHFAAKGLYEYIAACGNQRRQEDVELAKLVSDTLFKNVKDPAVLAAEGIPPGMQKHAVNFMTLIVAMESRKVFGSAYNEIVSECLHQSLHVFASDEYEAPFEYVGEDGQPHLTGAGRLVDPGHTMESLWFAMQEGRERREPALVRRAGQILDWVLDRAWDSEYGGFFQHVDVENTVPEPPFLTNRYGSTPVGWDDKIWWVQAEGLYTLAMSALLNENERHYNYFVRLKAYIDTFFRDKEYGEWYSFCRRDGALLSDAKGSVLKGPYHVPRCLMQLVSLLEGYLRQEAEPARPV